MEQLIGRGRDMVLGALVADAASMGLHWLYDQDRLADVAGGCPAFRTPDAADYDGFKGYFVHGGKPPGALSHYGEQLLVMLRALAETNGRYDKAAYEAAFRAHFGYGGTHVGYIDRATRDTLDNLTQAERAGGIEADTHYGSDDTQLPALSKLPPLVAAGQADHAESAIRVTNNTDHAMRYGQVAAAMLQEALQGAAPRDVARAGLAAASPQITPVLSPAFEATAMDCPGFTAQVGLSCELAYGVPSVLHNLLSGDGYRRAVLQNILAGGDNCGRAILLGAVLGACHGIGGDGIPPDWIDVLILPREVDDLLSRAIPD